MCYTKVADNVVATSFSSIIQVSNVRPTTTSMMTCIALPDELVFVDCGLSSEFAAKFRRDMEERFQRRTSHLLLTHIHRDHFWGMKAFKDVNVAASKKEIPHLKRLLKNIESRREHWAGRCIGNEEIVEAIMNADLFLPNISVKEKLTVGPEYEGVIFQVTGGHSAGSAYVYSPSERILCTGDNLLTCYAQLFGNGEKMLETYQHWETLDIKHVVPGHGEIVSKEYITKVRNYFEELIPVLRELKYKQLDLKSVLKHPKLPTYFGKRQTSWIEGSRCHTGWLNKSIKYWYQKLAKQK